jgi:hypothetical protein
MVPPLGAAARLVLQVAGGLGRVRSPGSLGNKISIVSRKMAL